MLRTKIWNPKPLDWWYFLEAPDKTYAYHADQWFEFDPISADALIKAIKSTASRPTAV